MTSSNGQSRHAVSPLCCDGSVPALQSPKNAVAPSDIIFDRPPVQVYSSADYSINNMQQVKSSVIADHSNANRNGVLLNINLDSHPKVPTGSKKAEVSVENHVVIHASDSCSVNSVKNQTNTKEATPADTSSVSNVYKRKDKCLKACSNNTNKEIRFIDEEQQNDNSQGSSTTTAASAITSVCISDSMVRSCSVGYLDLVDAQLVPCDIALHMLRKETPKRLVLVNRKNKQRKHKKPNINQEKDIRLGALKSPKLKNCGKSRSLDSSDIFPNPEIQIINHLPNHTEESTESQTNNDNDENKNNPTPIIQNNDNDTPAITKKDSLKLQFFSNGKSPLSKRKKSDVDNTTSNSQTTLSKNVTNKTRGRSKTTNSPNSVPNKSTIETNPTDSPTRNTTSLHAQALNTLENLLTRLRDLDDNKSSPPSSPRLPRSSPASPAPTKKGKRPQSASPIRKHLLNSPLLGRRSRKSKLTESSDDEVVQSGDEIVNSKNYKDLETFQKAQLRQKVFFICTI